MSVSIFQMIRASERLRSGFVQGRLLLPGRKKEVVRDKMVFINKLSPLL